MKTKPLDLATYLKTDEARAAFLADAVEDDNPEVFAHALGIVARSRGISDLAAETGLTRPGIYKAVAEDGNPSFATLRKLLDALGVEVTFRAKAHA